MVQGLDVSPFFSSMNRRFRNNRSSPSRCTAHSQKRGFCHSFLVDRTEEIKLLRKSKSNLGNFSPDFKSERQGVPSERWSELCNVVVSWFGNDAAALIEVLIRKDRQQ